MQELMTGDNDALPTLLVDAVNCRETISSIEKAPAGIRYKGQQKIIYKVKKSGEAGAQETAHALHELLRRLQVPDDAGGLEACRQGQVRLQQVRSLHARTR